MSRTDNPAQAARPLRVLFVGEPLIDLQTACARCCTRSVDIDVVADGRKAIRRLTNTSNSPADSTDPDLILLQCDFELPDGMTVLHAIKSSPHLNTVPVIVLGSGDTDSEQTYQTGGNAHVQAPETADDYADLIRSIIQFWLVWAQYPPESLYSNR